MSQDLLKALSAKVVKYALTPDVEVYLKPWSMAQRVAFLSWAKDNAKNDLGESYRRLISLSVVDEDGKTILSPEDVDSMDGLLCEKLSTEIGRLNGITGDNSKKEGSPATPS